MFLCRNRYSNYRRSIISKIVYNYQHVKFLSRAVNKDDVYIDSPEEANYVVPSLKVDFQSVFWEKNIPYPILTLCNLK